MSDAPRRDVTSWCSEWMMTFVPVQDHDRVEAWLQAPSVIALIERLYADAGLADAYRVCLTTPHLFDNPVLWAACARHLRLTSGLPIAIHDKVDELFDLLCSAADECGWNDQASFEFAKSVLSVGLLERLLDEKLPCSSPRLETKRSVMQLDDDGNSILANPPRHPRRRLKTFTGKGAFELDIVEFHEKGGRATEVKTHPAQPAENWYKQLSRYWFVHDYNDWSSDKPCLGGMKTTEEMAALLARTLRYRGNPVRLESSEFSVLGWDY